MPGATGGSTITDSAQINPGVIVDSDVSASAGIQGSKLQALSVGANAGVIPSTGIADAHVAASAAIAFPKLAALSRGGVLIGGASNVPTVLAAGNSGEFLQCLGSGADPVWAALSASAKLAATVTQTTIASSTTETTIATASIAAGALGTANIVRVTIPLSNFSFQNTKTVTFRVKYGGTTLITQTITNSGGSSFGNVGNGSITVYLIANASASAQAASIETDLNSQTAVVGTGSMCGFFVARGTATENSAGALNLVISAQFNTNSSEDCLTTGVTVYEIVR